MYSATYTSNLSFQQLPFRPSSNLLMLAHTLCIQIPPVLFMFFLQARYTLPLPLKIVIVNKFWCLRQVLGGKPYERLVFGRIIVMITRLAQTYQWAPNKFKWYSDNKTCSVNKYKVLWTNPPLGALFQWTMLFLCVSCILDARWIWIFMFLPTDELDPNNQLDNQHILRQTTGPRHLITLNTTLVQPTVHGCGQWPIVTCTWKRTWIHQLHCFFNAFLRCVCQCTWTLT